MRKMEKMPHQEKKIWKQKLEREESICALRAWNERDKGIYDRELWGSGKSKDGEIRRAEGPVISTHILLHEQLWKI